MDKLLWMRCFVRAVETGSFSAVARELRIGQPNVSRHVAALEKSLGTRLLHRSTRQMAATSEGQRYYTQARHALDIIAQAESEAHGVDDPHGLLRIACAESVGVEIVIPALPTFLHRYPHVNVDLRLCDAYIDLVAEGVDIAIRGGKLHDIALRARRVGSSTRICVASAAYLKQRGVPRQPGDLTQHECIVYTLLASDSGAWSFLDGDVQVSGRIRLNSLDGIRRAALHGMGIAYLPAWMVAKELLAGDLQALLTEYAASATPVHVLYSAQRLLPRRAAVFIEFITQVLADLRVLPV
ncbi:MAG: LysR family transcriptional regulator [Pseudomonadota bacterium]